MPKLKIGERYATATGLPVLLVGMEPGSLLLQSLVTDNQIAVPVGYPLEAPVGAVAAFSPRSRPYSPFVRPRRGRSEPKPLAVTIDALLQEGGRSMKGLEREVRRRASVACRGKNVKAGIRARMYWLQKRGMTLHRDDDGRVQIR
ncbi:MAG TPA: hypothetical protein DEB40_14260 [Elusimicrobia bacterium]|nr:hypothetical protein [Elusimicrobiota bacterium]HBT62896.1 hypothetical protein [Elusimicrobiota bacterium]